MLCRAWLPFLAAFVFMSGCRVNYDPLGDTNGVGGVGGRSGSSSTPSAGGNNQGGVPSGQGGSSGMIGLAGDTGVTTAGTRADSGGLAGTGGDASSAPGGGVALDSGGAPGAGGATNGGVSSGGAQTGGVITAGASSGGVTTGGVATGGLSTAGVSSGGVTTGGVATSGLTTGGVSSGGAATGGALTGGFAGQAGASGGFAGATSLGDCQAKSYRNTEYSFCATEITWTQASDSCAAVGMHLVRIDDADENQWVYDNIYDTGTTSSGLWIGASDLAVAGEWRWTDGTLFWLGDRSGSPQAGLFDAWYPAQPSGTSHNACAMMDSNNASTNWTTTGCASSNVFVCER